MMRRMVVAAGLGVVSVLAVSGCSSDGKAASVASSAASAAVSAAQSAAQSVASGAASAVGSAASAAGSAAGSAAASAQAAASSALASVKGGLDAKSDVTAGEVTIGSDGKASVQLNVTNHESQANQYTVQVNFTDASGNVLDATVVNVKDVAAGATSQATATSNRSLSGTVKAVVASALRY